jgi:hypothetical protein
MTRHRQRRPRRRQRDGVGNVEAVEEFHELERVLGVVVHAADGKVRRRGEVEAAAIGVGEGEVELVGHERLQRVEEPEPEPLQHLVRRKVCADVLRVRTHASVHVRVR